MIESDFHTHAFPPGMVPEPIHRARALSRAARLGRSSDAGYVDALVERMMANVHDPDADLLRAELESAGIRRAALHGLDWGLVSGDITEMTPEQQLEWATAVADRHDGFFRPFFGVDPRRPRCADLVARALLDERIGGIKLYPPAGFSPLDERCMAVYGQVEQAGATVLVHTGRQTFPFDLAHGRLEPYSEVQRRFPGLRLVLGHAGWPSWGREAIDVAAGHPTTFVEVSNWNREIATSPSTARTFLVTAWSELGPGRVLFGTDHFASPRLEGSETVRRWKEFVEATAAEAGVDMGAAEAAVDSLFKRG